MGLSAAGEVVGRFYEAFGAGDIDPALSVCADDLEIVDPGMGQVRGGDRFREYLETFKVAMPDARAIVEQTVESGETVAVRDVSPAPTRVPSRRRTATLHRREQRLIFASRMSRACVTGGSLPTTPTTTSSGSSRSSD